MRKLEVLKCPCCGFHLEGSEKKCPACRSFFQTEEENDKEKKFGEYFLEGLFDYRRGK